MSRNTTKNNKVAYALLKDLDQPSLIRVFAVHLQVVMNLNNLHTNREVLDQTGWMPRLI